MFFCRTTFFPASVPPRQPPVFSRLIAHSHLHFISASSFYFLSIGGYGVRLWRRTMNAQLLFIVLYCFVAIADARKLNKIKEQLRLNCHRPSFPTPKYIHNLTEPPNLILYPAVSVTSAEEAHGEQRGIAWFCRDTPRLFPDLTTNNSCCSCAGKHSGSAFLPLAK